MYSDDYSPTAYDNFVLYEKNFPNKQPCVILIDGTEIFDEDSAYYFHFYRWALKPTWVDTQQTPLMIFGSKGHIPQLINKLYDKHTQDYLNQHGLDIYLYETLTFAKNIEPFKEFVLEKDKNLIELIIESYGKTMVFETHQNDYSALECYELDSINLFAERNNLKNVNVYTCHYNINFIQHKYPNIKIHCKDLHLASMVDYPVEEQYPYQKVNAVDLIETKFVSPNWRYHSARHILMTYLIDKPGLYSWYYKGNLEKLKQNLWFDLDSSPLSKIVENGLPLLNSRCPLEINLNYKSTELTGTIDFLKYPKGTLGSPSDYRMDDAYLKSFCAVVTESFFAMPTGIVSEKILNAIKLGRPFVVLAPPKTLEYLHKLGFQTFERYWDEEYDSEPDHEKRLIKIFEVLDYINSMDIDQLKVWYSNMQDIIEHNASIVKHLKEPGNIL